MGQFKFILLPHLEVIKDLIGSRPICRFTNNMHRVEPWLKTEAETEDGLERRQSPEERERIRWSV